MAANIRETRIGVSYKKQTALQTPLTAADCWSFTKLNAALSVVDMATENDATEIGKGNEFALNNYKSHWNVTGSFEKYISSQFLAWVFCFGLGKTTKTAPVAGAYTYTCVPQDPVTDSIDMKAFTYVEAIRQGGSPVIDRAAVGCVISDFAITLASGPGRANAKVTANFIGSGKVVRPSTITIPSAVSEEFLNSASAAITINGVNYVTNKNFVMLEQTWNNSVRDQTGFYPGSGTDTGAAIRGRMELGDRVPGFKFQARFDASSTELTDLYAQTEGTISWSLQGALISGSTYHGCTVTWHRVRFATAVVNDADGIVTVEVTVQPLWHTTNGLLTAAVTTNQDNILA